MKASKFKRILVPVSLASDGTTAFKQALYFRKELSAKITLLHVVPASISLKNVLQPGVDKSVKARAMVRLIRFAKLHFRGRIPDDVELRVEIGNHVSVIKEVASEERFDLIVLNKSNRIEGLAGKLRKHSAEQIVGESICPVITVKDRYTSRGVRDILVPIDIAKKSRDLLNWSIFLGKLFNANIKLLAALTVKIELTKSLAYRKTMVMKELIEKEGVECSVGIVENENVNRLDALLEGAKQTKADLVIVQGHEDAMFSNSQTEGLVNEFMHSSKRPVLSLGIKREGFISDILATGKQINDRIPLETCNN